MPAKNRVVFLVVLLLAVVVTMAAALQQKAAGDASAKAQQKSERDDLPVVDAATSSRNNAQSELRKKRSKRYGVQHDKFKPRPIEESDSSEVYDLPISHSEFEPALPGEWSDTIIIGTVTDRQAHLSNDKSSIYSEFAVRVDEVLKNTSAQEVGVGSDIALERWGGGVRFSSGKVVRRAKSREQMPLANRQYVFYLRSQNDVQSFHIVTGYELRDGRVYPLDGVQGTGTRLPQFAAREGIEAEAFLNEVRSNLHQNAGFSPIPRYRELKPGGER
jgi:hypothetical protein